jgi:hypothetical protein
VSLVDDRHVAAVTRPCDHAAMSASRLSGYVAAAAVGAGAAVYVKHRHGFVLPWDYLAAAAAGAVLVVAAAPVYERVLARFGLHA